MKIKRRNFIKGLLAGFTGLIISPSKNTAEENKENKEKYISNLSSDYKIYLGLLYNGKEIKCKGYKRIDVTGLFYIKNGLLCNDENIIIFEAQNDTEINQCALYDSKTNGNMLLSPTFYRSYIIINKYDTVYYPTQKIII
jgi:hypothetical protein